MTGLLQSELDKLTTTRTPRWVLLLEALLVPTVLSAAVASGQFPAEVLRTAAGRQNLLEHGGLTALLSLVVGVLISAGEFRHGTVVDTFLSAPARGRVVLAKLVSGAVAGLALGLVSSGTALAAAAFWSADRNTPLPMDSTTLASVAGITGWHLLYTVLGVGLGFLIRSPAGAIVAAVLWLTLAETAISGFAVRLGRWLPGTSARALGGDPETGLLAPTGAGVVLLGWAVAVAVAGYLVTARRDVT